jgi:hypothetical protein
MCDGDVFTIGIWNCSDNVEFYFSSQFLKILIIGYGTLILCEDIFF